MNFERTVDSDIETLITKLCDKASNWLTSADEVEALTKQIARLRASLNPVVKIDR